MATYDFLSGSFATPSATPIADTLVQGASNDEIVDVLRRFLPPIYRNKPGWEALLAALASGDETIRNNAMSAFDQLFLSSASGNYLIERGADQGIVFPDAAGITEESFRSLAILLANNRQVQQCLLGILEVFYGWDATHARLESGNAEPYALTVGDTITFKVDDRRTVTATVTASDYVNVGAATAAEVAAVLSRVFRDAGASASATAVSIDGANKVVIYSGVIGLLGSLIVTGGYANRALRFATPIDFVYVVDETGQATWTWALTSQDEFRFTWEKFAPPGNLIDIQIGDYVTLNMSADSSLRGAWEVTDVHLDCNLVSGSFAGVTWFSVKPVVGFPYTTVSTPSITGNTYAGEIVFFRPTRQTVIQNPNPSFLAQFEPSRGVDVILPVTTQAVGRAYDAAAYLHDNIGYPIVYADHDPVNNTIYVGSMDPVPFVVGEVIELVGVEGVDGGRFNIVGVVKFAWSGGEFTLTPDQFSAIPVSMGMRSGSGGMAYAVRAPAGDVIGPYIFDENSPAITATETTSTATVAAGRGISNLPVASTTSFPDGEHYVVLGFATQYEVGPVRCFGVVDSSNLSIDRSFVFPKSVPSGSSVILLAQRTGMMPAAANKAFILTDSSAGRVAAEAFIDESKAAGINLNKIIVYPGDVGLGGAGDPTTGLNLSDKVGIWAGDNVDAAIEAAHNA
jgi:hypothetical protein